MQTFLPYSGFRESAEILDKKRAWKQVVEAKQLICSLRASNLPNDWIETKSYQAQPFKNHPARLMWKGYEELLKLYFNDFLEVCKQVHKINTKIEPLIINTDFIKFPFWLGVENFHRAMHSRLIEKNREFYLPLFPDDDCFNESKYFWPIMETQKFKII